MSEEFCTCEYPDINACDCGYVYCGMEDVAKLNTGVDPPIVGCGKKKYKCGTCGKYR